MPYSLAQGNHLNGTEALYSINFVPTNAIPSTGSIQLTYPSHVRVSETAQAGCVVGTSRTFRDVCEVQAAADATEGGAGGKITITNVFVDQASWTGEITVSMPFINPVNNFPRELGFGIKTYADPETRYMIDYLRDSDYRGLLIPRLECTHPCASCPVSKPTVCESCWQNDPESPAYLMRYEVTDADGVLVQTGECKDECLLGYTTDGDPDNHCVPCDASCKTCHQNGLPGDKDRCYLCSENHPYKLLGEDKCLAKCDKGLFESSGLEEGDENAKLTCSWCEAPCAECFGTKTNCTYCDRASALPVLMGNRCIAECPFGYTDVNGIC